MIYGLVQKKSVQCTITLVFQSQQLNHQKLSACCFQNHSLIDRYDHLFRRSISVNYTFKLKKEKLVQSFLFNLLSIL